MIVTLVCLCIASALKIAVLSKTDNQFVEGLAAFLRDKTGHEHQVRAIDESFLEDLEETREYAPDVVLDYSSSPLTIRANSKIIGESARYIRTSRDDLRYLTKLQQLYENPKTAWADVLHGFAVHFGWDEAMVLLTEDHALLVGDALRDSIYVPLVVSQKCSEEVIELFVTREVRASGVHNIVLMTSPQVTALLLKAMTKYQMDAGYSILIIGNNCQFDVTLYPTGLLCTTLAGSEAVSSESEMDYWYFLYALQYRPLSAWTILNLVQGSKYSVGFITQQTFSLSTSVVFPRGFTVPPSNDPFQLSLGLNNYLADSSVNPQRVYSFALEDFPLHTRRFVISVVKLPCFVSTPQRCVSASALLEPLPHNRFDITLSQLGALAVNRHQRSACSRSFRPHLQEAPEVSDIPA
jgi:hypothetical protein